MELKPGYKQTEVGVIPGDWSTPELGQILKSMQLGGNYKNSEIPTRWPLIKMGNLGRGTIKLDKLDFVDSKQSPAVRDRLCDGDVLFNTRNTLELVGKVAIWKEELPEAYFNSNIMRMDFDEQRVSSSAFMNFILNTAKSITNLRGIATGTTSVAAIYSRDLAKIVIPLPTKAEQVEIAEALSDADALIESLDQLIAKKRQIKQGAMQELLTGKRRLPGFGREWSTITMRDVLTMPATYGIVTAGAFIQNGVKMLRGGDIFDGSINNELPMVSLEKSAEYSRTVLTKNDVVIALVGYPGASAKIPDELIGSNISRAVGLLRLNDRVSPDYLVCMLNSPDGRRMVLAPSAGSAQQVVNLAALNKLQFSIPVREEQEAIASIFNEMDTELAVLESRLTKARQIKQGMMQELLTGRIRLI